MLIKNCKLVTPTGLTAADIAIEGGKIKKIGKALKGEAVLDAKGAPVLPGLIDAHVHLRDFEENEKEDLTSGTEAALAGGITSVMEMPNTRPAITDRRTYRRRLTLASKKCLVDFGTAFGVTPGNLREVEAVRELKQPPTAYKLYMDGTLGDFGDAELSEAFKRCGQLSIHAEDAGIIKRNLEYLGEKDDFLAYAHLREPLAEKLAIQKAGALAAEHGTKVHVCHISSKKGLSALDGRMTCEVTPHHLFLTESALRRYRGIAKTNPPVRIFPDIKALWDGLRGGRINMLVSDHAPHTAEEKEGGVFEAPPGIASLEVTLKLMLTQVNKGMLSLQRLMELMCHGPAKVYSLANKGRMEVGMDADLVILDMDKEERIDASASRSKAKFSPFDGWKTKGGVDRVILRGNLAFDRGEILAYEGYGKPLEQKRINTM